MKKIIFIFLLFMCVSNVEAISIGYSGSGEYDGIYMTDDSGKIAIVPNKKHALVVGYGDFQGDNADLSKIVVTFTLPQDFSITASSSDLGEGDTISGSGSNYTINLRAHDDDFSGEGVFNVKIPNITSTKEYKVTMTAKAYNASGSVIQTETGNYTYLVLVKPTNCDNNTNYTLTANLDGLKKTSEDFYTLSTNASSVTFTYVPSNPSTKVYYASWDEDLSISNNGSNAKEGYLSNNTLSINLKYGKNYVNFVPYTECYELGKRNEELLFTAGVMIGLDEASDVMAQNKIVSVDITRNDNRSTVNTLKSLSITGAAIDFKPELKNYIISVPYSESSITISSELTDAKSSYVKGYGNRTVNLKEGLNTVLVKVKAENEKEATYTLKITREKNNDSSLKSIMVDNKDVPIKQGVLIYSINVTNDIVKPTVKATANDSNAKVEVEKITELQEGSNEVSITVTASNGTKSVYVVDIIRDKLISNNSKLKKLEVTGQNIDFDKDKTDYQVHVGYDVEKLDLVIETDHEKAKYIVSGNKDLENESVIKIKVTAEDEETITTYTIKVEKDKKTFNILFVILPGILLIIIIVIALILKKKKNNNSASNIQANDNNVGNTGFANNQPINSNVSNSEFIINHPINDNVNNYGESNNQSFNDNINNSDISNIQPINNIVEPEIPNTQPFNDNIINPESPVNTMNNGQVYHGDLDNNPIKKSE